MHHSRGGGELVADLHVHTTASDGTLTVDEVPRAARAAGLDWVAVTDHDRVHPELDAPVVRFEGGDADEHGRDANRSGEHPVRVVRGIELRVETDAQRLDLLGYGVVDTDALVAETERLQRNRLDRAREMVDRIEDRVGVYLDVTVEHGVGRPHVARAVAVSDAPYDYEGAFEHLIGDDGPCFVARDVPGFERGTRLLRESCAIVGLAHPFRYDDVDAALEVATELDAVERWYPYSQDVDMRRIDRFAAEHDLLLTGGSDAHDRELGRAGLDEWAFAAVCERLPPPE